MTVRNLKVVRRRSNWPYNTDTIYLTCDMFFRDSGEWHKQDLTVTDDTAFKRLSDWNAAYDTPEVKRHAEAMIADIYANQARYGTGF